jgi:hypothetical protein
MAARRSAAPAWAYRWVISSFEWPARTRTASALISTADGTSLGLKYGVGVDVFLQWGEAAIFRIEAAYSPNAQDANPGLPLGIYVSDGLMF